MKVQDPRYREHVRAIFDKAPFIADLGLVLSDVGPGWCETFLEVKPKHLQQDGYVHGGVQATMADHTAGGAGGTLVRGDRLFGAAKITRIFTLYDAPHEHNLDLVATGTGLGRT